MKPKKIDQLEEELAAGSLGFEHLVRALGHMYEGAVHLKKSDKHKMALTLHSLPDMVGRLLLKGYPVEIMDGNHWYLSLIWIKTVFQSLPKMERQSGSLCYLSWEYGVLKNPPC